MQKLDRKEGCSSAGSSHNYECFYRIFNQKASQLEDYPEKDEPSLEYFEDLPFRGKDMIASLQEKKEELIGLEISTKLQF